MQRVFFQLRTFVACIRVRAFLDYATGVHVYVRTPYVQETRTDRTNVSKFEHKGRTNRLCILPKTIYLCTAVLLDDFAI